MPHLSVPHFSKTTWIILVAGAVALGLYLRHRSSAATSSDSTDSVDNNGDLPNLPDNASPYDTISGTDTTSGGGNYPYPAGGPGEPIRILVAPWNRNPKPIKAPAKKREHKTAHHNRHRARAGGGSGTPPVHRV